MPKRSSTCFCPSPTPSLQVLRVVRAAVPPTGDNLQKWYATSSGVVVSASVWGERLAPHLRAFAHCARASASLPGLNVHGAREKLSTLHSRYHATHAHVQRPRLPRPHSSP